MKLGVVAFNNELQIKYEFRCFDQYLTELWALGFGIFMKIYVFRTLFGLIFQILK
jgi:hypothetical protein